MNADKFVQLFEMPITGIHHVGSFEKGSSFRHAQDRKLVTHPKLVQRIGKAFENVGVDIELYFVNTPQARRYTELGRVPLDFVFTKYMGNPDSYEAPGLFNDTDIQREGLGLSREDIQIKEDTITLFFTNNKGDQRFPMTPWIIGHRFGHALYASRYGKRDYYYEKFCNLVRMALDGIAHCYQGLYPVESYTGYANPDPAHRAVGHALGTMRSARTRSLRNGHEFCHELFAQYLTTGQITLNPIPDGIPYRFAWGRPVNAWLRGEGRTEAESLRDTLLTELPYLAEAALGSSINSIFVM